MFLSMIESFFLNQHHLFEGLYIHNNPPQMIFGYEVQVWSKDLPPVPVIRLDFSKLTSNEGPDMLKKGLIRQLKSIGERYNITITYLDSVKDAIHQLIT